MTDSMKKFRCWSTSKVRETVYWDVGSLPGDADALFLAAHNPMRLEHSVGEEILGGGSGERQVLDALLSGVGDPHRNSLIAVTGESGAGKSHVVRWVNAHLDPDDDRYHVLYVPRAVQTIRQLLRSIVAGLPGEGGAELEARIDAAIASTSEVQFKDRLLEEIRFALTWSLEPRPARPGETLADQAAREDRNSLLGEDDGQGKRRGGLADLLALPQVNRTLLRADGLIDRVARSIYQSTSRRDEEDRFAESDLPLQEPGMSRALANNTALRELWIDVRHEPTMALSVLDEALRHALPKTLGLRSQNGETLDSLFRNSRQMLHANDKELVLLFEDLAQFGLVDGELYDQFATQPALGMAPLRVVFAVTNDPYGKLPDTVQTRITHRFSVKSSAVGDYEVFVARYLNMARLGRAEVEFAWRDAGAERDGWLPNACNTRNNGLPCQFREECHKAFGSVAVEGLGEVGLYPFNKSALARSLKNRGTDPTPREIIKITVENTLIEADGNIAQGTFPHSHTEQQFDFKVSHGREAVIGQKTGAEADRLYRALVIWGDEAPLVDTVTEAFSLNSSSARKPVVGVEVEPLAVPVVQSQVVHGQVGQKLPHPFAELFQWRNNGDLPDAESTEYRNILHRLVSSRLALEMNLFHVAGGEGRRILNDLFKPMSFNLAGHGRTAAESKIRFDLERNDDDVRVMVAARWFAEHGHWVPEEGRWQWPSGYDPADLMLYFEHRIEAWAAEVRAAFWSRVRGRGIARAAVGITAIAQSAAGGPPVSFRTLEVVLERASTAMNAAASTWTSASAAAKNALLDIRTGELVGEFAAVWQGVKGKPQLIDAVDLTTALHDALESPSAFLGRVAEELRDVMPGLAASAHDLLREIEKAAPELLDQVEEAVRRLTAGLEGNGPAAVARAAEETGRRAVANSLFRPKDGWTAFERALRVLEGLPADLPSEWERDAGRSDADEALRVQPWAAAVVAGAEAIDVLKRSLVETKANALENGSGAAELEQLRSEVRAKLEQVDRHLRAFGSSGAARG
ncbi:ATP-binding protein [Actinosynnema sp. NPDC002837]